MRIQQVCLLLVAVVSHAASRSLPRLRELKTQPSAQKTSSHFTPINPTHIHRLHSEPVQAAALAVDHKVVGRSASTYSQEYNGDISYEHLAALARVTADVGRQGGFVPTPTPFRFQQPLTPVYHATPIKMFASLREAYAQDAYVKPIVEKQGEESLPKEYSPFVGRSRGSVGKLTEAVVHKTSITKHTPIVYNEHSVGHQVDDNSNYASKYQFGYQVRDPKGGNYFGHSETKNGENTKGQYHVFLPDGRLQNVDYWVDKLGYHAHVTYERPATNQHAAQH